MTIVQIYGLVWILFLAAGLVLFLTSSFDELTLVLFGFGFSTLAVLGFIAVLPVMLDKYHEPKTYHLPVRDLLLRPRKSKAKRK
jgi:hypothetical protein